MAQRSRILVVDDEAPVGKSIAGALADKDLVVDTARSGEEALRLDGKSPYQVVITDLMMPGMTGMELLQKMAHRRPEAMVIMITGFPSVKTAVEAVKLGAFDYVTKPFTPAELRAVVRRALARQQLGPAVDDRLRPKEALYAIPENTWARVEEDGTVRVGMHPMFLDTIGHIGEMELPAKEDRIAQGEACVRVIDSRERVHRLWCPVSGTVTEVNEPVRHDLKPLANDPYGQGWLFLLSPDNLDDELRNLLPLEPAG